jgi:NADH-quinone oxidoreductase subunit G
MTEHHPTLEVNGRRVAVNGEKNLLELIRKSGIELPTFCYHSSLSVYGACRLCIVDIEGMGIQASCSIAPKPGMRIRTHTKELREMRRIYLELLLANHTQTCPTCERSDSCKLRELSAQLGIDKVRFKPVSRLEPVDHSSLALTRDPNKCVLCGDCVRYCEEIQGIGAIGFAARGSNAKVVPAFDKGLADGECVNCGGCASVCPTGALTPKNQTAEVWTALCDPSKTVVAQVAPACRVSLGEMFKEEAGTSVMGRLTASLRMLGFDQVYNTSFAADLTAVEETSEFLVRKVSGERLPLFTSCCPAWVKYAEQYFSDMLPHLSSCKSPQQMFGAVLKDKLCKKLDIERRDLVVVSVMPCTAKKFEAARPEFATDGNPDVDHVLTTQELGKMIKEAGICFADIEPASMDIPFGLATGAGVIFGSSGGVSEAVMRCASEKVTGKALGEVVFEELRDNKGIKIAEVPVGDFMIKAAVVHGLGNAKKVLKQIKSKELDVDIVEVMACPGGCVGGAGQPIVQDRDTVRKRARGIYQADKKMPLRKPQDNPFVQKLYDESFAGEEGASKVHHLLHTEYQKRRRIVGDAVTVFAATQADPIRVKVCVGTSCYQRGAQPLLRAIVDFVRRTGQEHRFSVEATFCMEQCDKGPSVTVGDRVFQKTSADEIIAYLTQRIPDHV